MTNEGKLKVWWMPQIPMNNAFEVKVETPEEGKKLLDTLARYDIFQLDNNIKPDFCNAGGLSVFENGEWVDWESENGESIDDVEF